MRPRAGKREAAHAQTTNDRPRVHDRTSTPKNVETKPSKTKAIESPQCLSGRKSSFSPPQIPVSDVTRKSDDKSPMLGAALTGGASMIKLRGWNPRLPKKALAVGRKCTGRGQSFERRAWSELAEHKMMMAVSLGRIFPMRSPGAVRFAVVQCFRYLPFCSLSM